MNQTNLNTPLAETIFKISRYIKDIGASRNEFSHLTMLQIQALCFLKKKPSAQMSEIAQYFKIELPSATSLVNKLCTMELVTRKADEKDRRLVLIALTEKGEKLLASSMQERAQRIEKVFSYLSIADREDLIRIMHTLLGRLEEAYES